MITSTQMLADQVSPHRGTRVESRPVALAICRAKLVPHLAREFGAVLPYLDPQSISVISPGDCSATLSGQESKFIAKSTAKYNCQPHHTRKTNQSNWEVA